MANPEIVKTQITHYKILNVALDFLTFDERYRNVRRDNTYQGFECFNCGKYFLDGEKMSLAFTNKLNKVICRDCGVMFKSELLAEVTQNAAD